MSTRIILADDHPIFRGGLRALLREQPGLEVVAEVSDGLQAVEAAREQRPDVVVTDVSMPTMNGVEATRRIVEMLPRVKVLCLSMHTDSEFVLAVLEAGASGYVVKDCALVELVSALGAVMAGEVYLSPRIAGHVVLALRHELTAESHGVSSVMTTREKEVLLGIVAGHSTGEIAASLHISPKTVGTHRQHLMDKLDIHTIAGLTKYAIRQGLTSSDPM